MFTIRNRFEILFFHMIIISYHSRSLFYFFFSFPFPLPSLPQPNFLCATTFFSFTFPTKTWFILRQLDFVDVKTKLWSCAEIIQRSKFKLFYTFLLLFLYIFHISLSKRKAKQTLTQCLQFSITVYTCLIILSQF